MSSTPALELSQLTVSYGGIRAVKGISLSVEDKLRIAQRLDLVEQGGAALGVEMGRNLIQ